MRLTNVIDSEENKIHRKELTEGPFLDLLKSRCKNSHIIATKTPFFRHDKGAELMLITPEAKEERSAFWIDSLIKEFSDWKRFPSRARCIKGFTSYSRMHEADDVYVIIPFDGTRVGVTPKGSFYKSFTDIESSLGYDRVDNQMFKDWISALIKMLSDLSGEEIKFSLETYSQLKKTLEKIDTFLSGKKELLKKKLSEAENLSLEEAKMMKDLLHRHVNNMFSYLSEKLSPELNGFSFSRIESFSKGNGDHEIWIDSPCLLIKRTKYIELHKQGAF